MKILKEVKNEALGLKVIFNGLPIMFMKLGTAKIPFSRYCYLYLKPNATNNAYYI